MNSFKKIYLYWRKLIQQEQHHWENANIGTTEEIIHNKNIVEPEIDLMEEVRNRQKETQNKERKR